MDIIKDMIFQMEKYSENQQYEEANKILLQIKDELLKKETSDGIFEKLDNILYGEKNSLTIKNTYDIIVGYIIRLNPDLYKFSDFLKLVVSVTEKLEKIKHYDDYAVRKMVAEEMLSLKMFIPQTYKGKKPNRAFLDVAYKVNPDLCKKEIERREKVKLWKAIESGRKGEIQKVINEVNKYHKGGE